MRHESTIPPILICLDSDDRSWSLRRRGNFAPPGLLSLFIAPPRPLPLPPSNRHAVFPLGHSFRIIHSDALVDAASRGSSSFPSRAVPSPLAHEPPASSVDTPPRSTPSLSVQILARFTNRANLPLCDAFPRAIRLPRRRLPPFDPAPPPLPKPHRVLPLLAQRHRGEDDEGCDQRRLCEQLEYQYLINGFVGGVASRPSSRVGHHDNNIISPLLPSSYVVFLR